MRELNSRRGQQHAESLFFKSPLYMHLLFHPNYKTSTRFNLNADVKLHIKFRSAFSSCFVHTGERNDELTEGRTDRRMDELIIGDPQRSECAGRQNSVPSTVTQRPKTKHRTYYEQIIWFEIFRGQLTMWGITWRSHWELRLNSSAVWRREIWHKFTWHCVLWYKFTWTRVVW
jgi:hypothetical protein